MSLESFTWPDEFVSLDGRNQPRTGMQSYPVSQKFFSVRHGVTLTPELVKGASVLDLGSYLGTTGYWCMAHGCRSYTGVELISKYANTSRELLSTYSTAPWAIQEREVQEYINTTDELFDIVVAWGVFNTFTDPIAMLEKLLTMANHVFVDVAIPNVIINNDLNDQETPIIEINPWSCMGMEDFDNLPKFQGSRISVAAMNLIAKRMGFDSSSKPYEELKTAFPDIYGPKSDCKRAMAYMSKGSPGLVKTYRDLHV